ncbi:MAG: response regulator [Sphingobacteriales bacterium]
MFKKILIAEDHESANISVRKTLEDLGIVHPEYVYYCDDALLQIKNGLVSGEPYELLITDLSFDADGREQRLSGGEALIAAARQVQPNLKVLVFSIEKKPAVIDHLFKDTGINGYVIKGRHDAQELKSAIADVYKNKPHAPIHLRQTIRQKNTHDFTGFDIMIIGLLAQGKHQKDIPSYLEQNQVRPSSLSSLEKRLNLIRDAYEFSNNEQLVAFCKDMGII